MSFQFSAFAMLFGTTLPMHALIRLGQCHIVVQAQSICCPSLDLFDTRELGEQTDTVGDGRRGEGLSPRLNICLYVELGVLFPVFSCLVYPYILGLPGAPFPCSSVEKEKRKKFTLYSGLLWLFFPVLWPEQESFSQHF